MWSQYSSKIVWSVVMVVVLRSKTIEAQYGQYEGGDVIRGKSIQGSSFGHGVGQRVGEKEFVVGSSLKVADDHHHPHRQALIVGGGHRQYSNIRGFGQGGGHHGPSQHFQGEIAHAYDGLAHDEGGFGSAGHNEISHEPYGHGYKQHPRFKHGHNVIHSGYHGGPPQVNHGSHHGLEHGHNGNQQPHFNDFNNHHHGGPPQYHHHSRHPEAGHGHHHGGYVSFRGYGNYKPAYRVGAGVGHHHTGRGHTGSHHMVVEHNGYGY